jgi:Spy/CpxP family protein refolding chaperone
MKMSTVQSLIVAILVSATSLLAQEQPMKRPEGQPGGPMAERMKLSDDQRNQIQKIRTDFQKQQISQRSKLETSRLELRELMRADNPDKAAIEKKINEVSQLGAQSRIGSFNQMLAIRKVLTPEQQKMMREGMRMRMQRGFAGPQQRMGGFMRGPQGRRFQMEGRMGRPGQGMQFERRMGRQGQGMQFEGRMRRFGPEDRREF